MNEVLRANTAPVIAAIRQSSGRDLPCSRESVAWFADYLEQLRGKTDLRAMKTLCASVAVFLGDSLIAIHGGAWIEVDDEWMVQLGNGCITQPFASVEEQVDWGKDLSILDYFDTVNLAVHSA